MRKQPHDHHYMVSFFFDSIQLYSYCEYGRLGGNDHEIVPSEYLVRHEMNEAFENRTTTSTTIAKNVTNEKYK
jgi:hypothetical protein